MRIIVDTNILFSALFKKDNVFIEIILAGKHEFYICEFTLVELFKHKEKILKNSSLNLKELLEIYHLLLKKVKIFNEDDISDEILMQAYNFCKDKDKNDTVFVALAISLNGYYWTGDSIKNHLILNGFNNVLTTKELLNNI